MRITRSIATTSTIGKSNYAPTITLASGTGLRFLSGAIGLFGYDLTLDQFGELLAQNPMKVIHSSDREDIPIDAEDLDYLRSLQLLPATHRLEVTDQSGEPIEWLAEYIISLREVQ